MNRLDQLFAQKSEGLLSLYFCAGHPTLHSTLPTLRAIEARGIDFVEVGIPYSDPLADGPVIQSASQTALHNGMTLRLLFDELEAARPEVQLPIVLMGYLNPILRYGYEAFFARCEAVGVDGVIIPDLPLTEYLSQVKPLATRHGIRVIMLITPETPEERIRMIDAEAGGFIYMVSSAATTGAQQSFDEAKEAYFERVAGLQLLHPRMIGFGISNRQTLSMAHQHAAGAIVGSKFVALLTELGDADRALDALFAELAQ